MPKAINALSAIKENTFDHDGWLCYQGNPNGISNKVWMDSKQGGIVNEDGSVIDDWIANVEVQAFAWKALKIWQDILHKEFSSGRLTEEYFEGLRKNGDITDSVNEGYIEDLGFRADVLKKRFNALTNDVKPGFKIQDEDGTYYAHALAVDTTDGKTVTRVDKRISINPGFCLWANYQGETIMDSESSVDAVVQRLATVPGISGARKGLFSFNGSTSTFERRSVLANPDNYHVGYNIHWPVASNVIAKGILEIGETLGSDEYIYKADKILYYGVIKPVVHFNDFIEQFQYQNNPRSYSRYVDPYGHMSNANQTWTLTAFLYAMERFKKSQDSDLVPSAMGRRARY